MVIVKTEDRILKKLLKESYTDWTITELSLELGMSRVGIWKALQRLEKQSLVKFIPRGKGKTSVANIVLDWKMPVLQKRLSLLLAEEAQNYPRWLNDFQELQNHTDMIILHGSILKTPETANDIDIIQVIPSKKSFIDAENLTMKIQKTLSKKIHPEYLTRKELNKEIKSNDIFRDAIKKGIILFGQDEFVGLMKDVQNERRST